MNKKDKGRLAPFVPLLKDTLHSDAWKALSHGARSLYVALKARYSQNVHNNGRIYLPQRIAAEEIGSDTNQVTRWFRELQHYGFIVMTVQGCLGVDGKGQAPKWRLTELGHMKDPPTRDFLRWNGEPFVAPKKQNPVRESTDKLSVKARTGASVKTRTPKSHSVRESTDKGKDQGVRESTDKSRLTTCMSDDTPPCLQGHPPPAGRYADSAGTSRTAADRRMNVYPWPRRRAVTPIIEMKRAA